MERAHGLIGGYLCALLSLCHAPAESAEQISIGQRHQLDSKQMGEMRSFLVHTPADYVFTKQAYPVVIVLDGDDHFAHVSATVDFLSREERIPKMIVVGVPNTHRERDLVPPTQGRLQSEGIGGPDKFLAFIGEELIPEIDRRYRTRAYRVLAGHSNAGLFTIYSLLSKPSLFNGYVAISPAFNNQDELAKRLEPFLVENKTLRADLFMTLANEGGQNLGGAYEIASLLQEKAPRDLRWEFRRYPEETHGSIAMRSVYDGLQAVFNGWYIHDPFAVYEQGGLAALEKNYAAVSSRVGYVVPIPERIFVTVFAALESRSRPADAAAVIEQAAGLYPTSAYVQFYLGRIYSQLGDTTRGIEHLTKSLQLAPAFGAPRALLKARNIDASTIVPHFDVSASTLAAYVGGYGSSEVAMEIVSRSGTLYAKTAQREFVLEPMTDARFYYVNGEDVLVFRRNARGRIAGVTLQSTGAELVKLK